MKFFFNAQLTGEGCEAGDRGEEEEDDPDFDPSKVKPGQGAQECKQQ